MPNAFDALVKGSQKNPFESLIEQRQQQANAEVSHAEALHSFDVPENLAAARAPYGPDDPSFEPARTPFEVPPTPAQQFESFPQPERPEPAKLQQPAPSSALADAYDRASIPDPTIPEPTPTGLPHYLGRVAFDAARSLVTAVRSNPAAKQELVDNIKSVVDKKTWTDAAKNLSGSGIQAVGGMIQQGASALADESTRHFLAGVPVGGGFIGPSIIDGVTKMRDALAQSITKKYGDSNLGVLAAEATIGATERGLRKLDEIGTAIGNYGAQQQNEATSDPNHTWAQRQIVGAAGSVPATVAGLGAGLLGGPAGPITGAATFGLMSSGQSYNAIRAENEKRIREGKTPYSALDMQAFGWLNGLTEVATEYLPTKVAVGRSMPFVRKLIEYFTEEVPGETVSTAVQHKIAELYEMDPEWTPDQWRTAMVDTVVQTMLLGGPSVGLAHAVNKLRGDDSIDMEQLKADVEASRRKYAGTIHDVSKKRAGASKPAGEAAAATDKQFTDIPAAQTEPPPEDEAAGGPPAAPAAGGAAGAAIAPEAAPEAAPATKSAATKAGSAAAPETLDAVRAALAGTATPAQEQHLLDTSLAAPREGGGVHVLPKARRLLTEARVAPAFPAAEKTEPAAAAEPVKAAEAPPAPAVPEVPRGTVESAAEKIEREQRAASAAAPIARQAATAVAPSFEEQLKQAREETNTEPTEGQKAAGNYSKGTVQFAPGLTVRLENPAGSTRTGVNEEGEEWSSTLTHDYGYVTAGEATDGDKVDAFLTGKPDTGQTFVIHQKTAEGQYDEPKAILGASTRAEAIATYKANYPKGWDRIQSVEAMPTQEFARRAKAGEFERPPERVRIRRGDQTDEPVIERTPQRVHWDTPEFQRWFSGSTVKNADGTPRVMYHGTRAGEDFDAFRIGHRFDIGSHFGTAGQAEDRLYNLVGDEPAYHRDDIKPRTLPVYLNIKNPLRLPDLGEWNIFELTNALQAQRILSDKEVRSIREDDSDAAAMDALRDLLMAKGYDGIVYKNAAEIGGAPDLRRLYKVIAKQYVDVLNNTTLPPLERGNRQIDLQRRMAQIESEIAAIRDKANEDSYIIFRPDQVKSAIANSGAYSNETGSIMFRRREPPKTKSGKYRGAPEWVKTEKDLQALRRLSRKLVREGMPGRFWYEDSAREIERITGNIVDAEKLIQLMAIYSPNTAVIQNTIAAVRVYNQWKNGAARGEIHAATEARDSKARAVLYDGVQWEGRKTNSFYLNLMHDIVSRATPEQVASLHLPADLLEEINNAVTVDVWVMRAFGYRNAQAGNDKLYGRYSFVEGELQNITDEMNASLKPGEPQWLPHQVQAALWTAIKARYESEGVRQQTIKESVEKGYSTYENGVWTMPKTADALREHQWLWRENALALSAREASAAVEKAKSSFADILNSFTQTVTWEALPGRDAAPVLFSLPKEIRAEYTRDAMSLVLDANGGDAIAQRIGVPLSWTIGGHGSYMGNLNLNVITGLVPTKPAGAFDATKVRLYSRIVQYIYRQEAVPWFRADALAPLEGRYVVEKDGKVVRRFDTYSDARQYAAWAKNPAGLTVRLDGRTMGLKLTFKKDLSEQALEQIYQDLQWATEGRAEITQVTPRDIVVINYADQTGLPVIEDDELDRRVNIFRSVYGAQRGLEAVGRFTAETEYGPVHDWRADPEGRALEQSITAAGGPDLLAWVRDRRAKVDDITRRYEAPRSESALAAPVPVDRLDGDARSQREIYGRFGVLDTGHDTTGELKFYDLAPAVERPGEHQDRLTNELRARVEFFSFNPANRRLPRLGKLNYRNGTVWIYDPREAHGSFKDSEYTRAWRVYHEVAHGIAEHLLTERYGPSRRYGRMGREMKGERGLDKRVEVTLAPLTLLEAQRAVEWEDLAFRIQRLLMERHGIRVPAEAFAREYNTNIADATFRVLTGDFGNPGEYGFYPRRTLPDLKGILTALQETEKLLAKSQGREPTQGIDLSKFEPVSDKVLKEAVNAAYERQAMTPDPVRLPRRMLSPNTTTRSKQVHQIVKKFTRLMHLPGAEIVVYDTPQDLPASTKRWLYLSGDTDYSRTPAWMEQGIHHDRIVVVASNVGDAEHDLVETLIHEIVGHYGLRQLMPPGSEEYNALMDEIVAAFPERVRELVRHSGYDQMADISPLQQLRLGAEELIAYTAEKMRIGDQLSIPEKTFLQKVVAMLKRAFHTLTGNKEALARMSAEDKIIEVIARSAAALNAPRVAHATSVGAVMKSTRAPLYYSQLWDALNKDKSGDTQTAENWIRLINAMQTNGKVKKEELRWVPVLDWLQDMAKPRDWAAMADEPAEMLPEYRGVMPPELREIHDRARAASTAEELDKAHQDWAEAAKHTPRIRRIPKTEVLQYIADHQVVIKPMWPLPEESNDWSPSESELSQLDEGEKLDPDESFVDEEVNDRLKDIEDELRKEARETTESTIRTGLVKPEDRESDIEEGYQTLRDLAEERIRNEVYEDYPYEWRFTASVDNWDHSSTFAVEITGNDDMGFTVSIDGTQISDVSEFRSHARAKSHARQYLRDKFEEVASSEDFIESRRGTEPIHKQYTMPNPANYGEVLFRWMNPVNGLTFQHTSHWPNDEDKDYIVHLRHDDRRAANGGRVLNMHEIQSDWLQELREQDRSVSFESAKQRIVEELKNAESSIDAGLRAIAEVSRLRGETMDDLRRNPYSSRVLSLYIGAVTDGRVDTRDLSDDFPLWKITENYLNNEHHRRMSDALDVFERSTTDNQDNATKSLIEAERIVQQAKLIRELLYNRYGFNAIAVGQMDSSWFDRAEKKLEAEGGQNKTYINYARAMAVQVSREKAGKNLLDDMITYKQVAESTIGKSAESIEAAEDRYDAIVVLSQGLSAPAQAPLLNDFLTQYVPEIFFDEATDGELALSVLHLNEAVRQYDDSLKADESNTPPFKDTYALLPLKWAIKEAVEKGYDYIGMPYGMVHSHKWGATQMLPYIDWHFLSSEQISSMSHKELRELALRTSEMPKAFTDGARSALQKVSPHKIESSDVKRAVDALGTEPGSKESRARIDALVEFMRQYFKDGAYMLVSGDKDSDFTYADIPAIRSRNQAYVVIPQNKLAAIVGKIGADTISHYRGTGMTIGKLSASRVLSAKYPDLNQRAMFPFPTVGTDRHDERRMKIHMGNMEIYDTVMLNELNSFLKKFGSKFERGVIALSGVPQTETDEPVQRVVMPSFDEVKKKIHVVSNKDLVKAPGNDAIQYPDTSRSIVVDDEETYRALGRNTSYYSVKHSKYFIGDRTVYMIYRLTPQNDDSSARKIIDNMVQQIFENTSFVYHQLAPVTDQMREAVKNTGFPLFQRNPQVMQQQVIQQGPRSWWVANAERASAYFNYIAFKIQDRFRYLLTTQREVASQMGVTQLPDDVDSYMEQTLYHGRVEDRVEKYEKAYIEPLVKMIKDSGYSWAEVEDYLYARHAPEANAWIAQINGGNTAFNSGMSDADAAQIMADLAQLGDIRKLHAIGANVDQMTAWNRQTMVSEGLMDPAVIQSWENTYQHYVPLKGWRTGPLDEYDLPRKGKGFDTGGKLVKSRLGRQSLAANILANIVAQAHSTIIIAEKAKVGRSFLRFAMQNPSSMWKIEPVETERYLDKNTGMVATRQVSASQMAARYMPDNIMRVKDGGTDYHIVFDETDETAMLIANAMKNLNADKMGILLQGMHAINRFLSTVNTSLNPDFVISNLLRDLQTAGINMEATQIRGLQLAVLRDWRPAWWGIEQSFRGKTTTWSQHWADFKEAGAKVGWIENYRSVADLEKKIMGELAPKSRLARLVDYGARPLVWVGEVIENRNLAVENAIRLSAYVNAINIGVSRSRAAELAKNLTVNFNRRGDWGPMLNALYLFFNASMQGTAVIFNTMRNKRARRVVYGLVAMSIAMEILNRLMGGDDDDEESRYTKIPDSVKARNIVVMLPPAWRFKIDEGREIDYMKFPLPYGYNVFWMLGQKVGEGIDHYALGSNLTYDPVRAATSLALEAFESFNPIGAAPTFGQYFMPTIGDPFLQISENMDGLGNPIMPEKPFDRVPDPYSHRFFSSVSPASKEIAAELNRLSGGSDITPGRIDISPEVMDLFWDTALGGVGRFISNTASTAYDLSISPKDLEVGRVPILRRLIGSVGDRYTREAFYDNVLHVSRAQEEFDTAQLLPIEKQADAMSYLQRRYPVESQFIDTTPENRRDRTSLQEVQRELTKLAREKKAIIRQNEPEKIQREMLRPIEQQQLKLMNEFNRQINEVRKASSSSGSLSDRLDSITGFVPKPQQVEALRRSGLNETAALLASLPDRLPPRIAKSLQEQVA